MNPLPVVSEELHDCWNQIGVRGDRSCAELEKVVHCHNCHVFSSAGRKFLDAPSPTGYLQEWTQRLVAPIEKESTYLHGVLTFRLATEWLALPVNVLVEVTTPRPIHRIPHRGGNLAGVVNIRGELHLCIHLDQVLGIQKSPDRNAVAPPNGAQPRFLVARKDSDRWVFPVDEVDQVDRVPLQEISRVPATVSRSLARLSRGLFRRKDRAIGLLDENRLFQTLQSRTYSSGPAAAGW